MTGSHDPLARVYRSLSDMDPIDLVTRLTLLLLLLSTDVVGDAWQLKGALRVLALLGLLAPPLNRNRGLWLLVTVFLGARTYYDLWTQPDHAFLLTYWALALFLSLGLKDAGKALATSAKLLLGFCFLFATLWKLLLSPEFMDGTSLCYALMTDVRLQDVGVLLGGMKDTFYEHNLQELARLGDPKVAVEAVTLQGSKELLALAKTASMCVVAVEAALAVTLLWPGRWGPARLRDALLLLFGITLGLIPLGVGFGFVLMILGAAQCEPDRKRTRFLYVATCALIVVLTYAEVPSCLRTLLC
ncbi:hypothetical protein ACFL59_05040 [Planctomycetota bacterium]